jgi:hypothetical protein
MKYAGENYVWVTINLMVSVFQILIMSAEIREHEQIMQRTHVKVV